MEFKHTLPRHWIDKVRLFYEFANGGTQVSIKVKSGDVYSKVLISNCKHIIAMRNHESLPFDIDDIVDIFQTEEDKNPTQRGGWFFWDNWK
jgi:hypothetical protein